MAPEEKKKRQTVIYPPTPTKDKVKKYAEKTSMSMSELFIEGAKLYMKMNPILQ